MKSFTCHSFLIRSMAVAALAGSACAAMAQESGATCEPTLSPLQQRLLQRADEGPATLRNFIFSRRAILQLDTNELMTWAEKVQDTRATCRTQALANKPEAPTLVAGH